MFSPKRLVTLITSALTLGVGAVLVLSATTSGSTALRSVASNLAVNAHAAGGGGGQGVIFLTIDPRASLTAKLAATVSISYTCQPAFDPTTGFPIFDMSSSLFVQVQQRQGKVIAHGSGFTNGNAICDNVTVNHASVVVVPDFYPGFTSPPFKNGAALASVSANACGSATAVSPPFFACDFGSAGPTAISIK
jgi:hypothetical protein